MYIRINAWVLCWDSAGEISSTDFCFIRKFSTINKYLTKASAKLELFSFFFEWMEMKIEYLWNNLEWIPQKILSIPWKCATYSLRVSDTSFLFNSTLFKRFLLFSWIVVHRNLWIWVLEVTKTTKKHSRWTECLAVFPFLFFWVLFQLHCTISRCSCMCRIHIMLEVSAWKCKQVQQTNEV